MGTTAKKYDNIDIVCMMAGNGEITPMKLRVVNDNGERQVFKIESFTDLSHRETYTTSDGLFVTNNIRIFDCKIHVFGQQKSIRLYYDDSKSKWTMAA